MSYISDDLNMVHVRGDGRTYSVACNRQLSRADGRIPCHIDTAARRAAPALDEAREKSGLQDGNLTV